MKNINKVLPNVYEIENFFVDLDAEIILNKFHLNKKWEKILQNKPNHYSHIFKDQSSSMPDEHEPYLSSFWKNLELANDNFIKEKTYKAIEKIFYNFFQIKNFSLDIRCHKFEKNNFFRIHMDGYAGGYDLTVSLNKNWKWDWGGILNIAYGKNNSQLLGLLPKWNSANLIDNYIHPSPHYVTPIQDYALETRYTITCFIKTKI